MKMNAIFAAASLVAVWPWRRPERGAVISVQAAGFVGSVSTNIRQGVIG